MAGSNSGRYRDDLQTHLCLRCFAAVDCLIPQCRHREIEIVLKEFDDVLPGGLINGIIGKCRFCKELTDNQCAKLRKRDTHVLYHRGLVGKKMAKRVASALGIGIKDLSE